MTPTHPVTTPSVAPKRLWERQQQFPTYSSAQGVTRCKANWAMSQDTRDVVWLGLVTIWKGFLTGSLMLSIAWAILLLLFLFSFFFFGNKQLILIKRLTVCSRTDV